jgi:hypothetical protein
MFANAYTMKGVHEANKKNDWWGWKIDLHKSVNDYPNASYIVNEANTFKELVKSGEIDPAPETQDDPVSDMKTVNPSQDDLVLGSS